MGGGEGRRTGGALSAPLLPPSLNPTPSWPPYKERCHLGEGGRGGRKKKDGGKGRAQATFLLPGKCWSNLSICAIAHICIQWGQSLRSLPSSHWRERWYKRKKEKTNHTIILSNQSNRLDDTQDNRQRTDNQGLWLLGYTGSLRAHLLPHCAGVLEEPFHQQMPGA